jgi:T5SS/PEP-CTERM-associated repeat protein
MNKAQLGAAIAAAAGLGAICRAQQTWSNPAGGSFHLASNWSPAQVPGNSNTAFFSLTTAYTVGFSSNVSLNACWLNYGQVTFALAGRQLNVLSTGFTTPGLMVGAAQSNDASLVVQGGTVSVVNASIADIQNTQVNRPRGRLVLDGAGAGLTASGEFGCGVSGPGTFVAQGGATATIAGAAVMGWYSGSNAVATVTGAGSSMNSRDLIVGRDGRGRMIVRDGASAGARRIVTVGQAPGADGQMVVLGAGSRFLYQGEGQGNDAFTVGSLTPGVLCALDGGIVQSNIPVVLGPQGLACGNSTLAAALSNGGKVAPGGAFEELDGSVVPSGLGTLLVGASYTQPSQGALEIEIAGRNSGEFDVLQVGGTASLGGLLRVSTLAGFQPSDGDSFTFLSATSRLGAFGATELPPLSPGLSWQFQYASTAVTLVVVPSPGACVLVAVAGGFCGRRPRRARW